MKIQVRGQEKEILVQTVSIHKNRANPDVTFLFSCPYCCDNVAQVQGVVDGISPGLTPTDDAVVINKSFHCSTLYTFQNTISKRDRTKVVLTRHHNFDRAGGNTFYCYICKTPLIHFDYGELRIIPLDKEVEFPISLSCPFNNCPAKYSYVDLV